MWQDIFKRMFPFSYFQHNPPFNVGENVVLWYLAFIMKSEQTFKCNNNRHLEIFIVYCDGALKIEQYLRICYTTAALQKRNHLMMIYLELNH